MIEKQPDRFIRKNRHRLLVTRYCVAMLLFGVAPSYAQGQQEFGVSKYRMALTGDLPPIEGGFGRNLPIAGSFKVSGDVRTADGSQAFVGKITDWTYLYRDSSKRERVGWGVVVT